MTPIRPENRSKYPRNWKAIRAEILARSGGRCECLGECGLLHRSRCVELHGRPAKLARGRVVLTIAHLNHNPRDSRRRNLRALCQRCHNRYDVEHRKATRRRTRVYAIALAEALEKAMGRAKSPWEVMLP